jgi:Cof subfamily protein (haloacid dehalogenase superfamily)
VAPADAQDGKMSVPYRLIALDLDGTTLNAKGHVSPRTRAAIAAVVASGAYVAFATGRNYTEAKPVLVEAGHFPLAVFAGGALIVDTREERALLAVPMHGGLARELSADLEGLGHAVLALQNTFATGVDYFISERLSMEPATSKWLHLTQTVTELRPNLAVEGHEGTLRISVVVPAHQAPDVADLLEAKYTGRAIWHSITVPQRNVEVIEIFDPAATKWTGLGQIAARLGVKTGEILAVGDDVNDLAMLSAAGLGVAMGNGHPLAKSAAKRVIGHNDEDGLAIFLEELLEKGELAAA